VTILLKNRLIVISVMMCLILGTIPFALGATAPKISVSISDLYVGAPGQTNNQEYVQVKNTGTTAVSVKGWKIKDKTKKHTYSFPSTYTLKSKATVTIYTGKGTNSATKLYWGSGAFVWNNEGDTAYLYNAQGTLVSTKVGAKVK
jgi:predicted extracellular nuclease